MKQLLTIVLLAQVGLAGTALAAPITVDFTILGSDSFNITNTSYLLGNVAFSYDNFGDAAATAADVLARAKQSPALASALSLDATPFDDISGDVTIAEGSVGFAGLQVATALFAATATGSVSRGGALEAHGTVALTPAATAAIAALVPESQRMFGTGGRLEVPFSLAGRWPDVDVRVDVRTAIARLMAPLDPRLLAIGPRVAG